MPLDDDLVDVGGVGGGHGLEAEVVDLPDIGLRHKDIAAAECEIALVPRDNAPQAPSFLVSAAGKRLVYVTVQQTFAQLAWAPARRSG